MRLKYNIVYIFVIAVLAIMFFNVLDRKEKVVERIEYMNDTITITEYDTIKFTEIVEIERERIVVDTFYFNSNDNIVIPIPISKYRFFEENKYDITARGFNVTLDNVSVFPKTEYRTITNTIEKYTHEKSWCIYLGADLRKLKDDWVPSISTTIKTPYNWLFGASIGVYDGSPIYGINLQYKIR